MLQYARTMKYLAMLILTLLTHSAAASSTSPVNSGFNSDGLSESASSANRYEILFLGNSHSSYNDLPGLVSTLIESGDAGSTALAIPAPGWKFLDERLNDGVTLQSLNSRPWTHVILQAQKYSTSGRFTYPTQAAEEWIRRVKARNGLPVMFPEWPRRGNTEEGPRVHHLHLDIALREPACVAPIGLAWEESIAHHPGLELHAFDGNHSNLNGALLTAYVLYQVITLQDASMLPYIPEIDVNTQTQQNLRDIASSLVNQHLAYCIASGLQVDPQEVSFGVGSSGISKGQIINLRNPGILPMSLESIVAPAKPFALELESCASPPFALEPKASCTLKLEFQPEFDGFFADSIELNSSGLDSPVIVSLDGFSGPIVPALNHWGLLVLVLLVAGSTAFLRR